MPDFTLDNVSGSEFEASVRHVARQLYGPNSTMGSVKLDGRERDEIIDTGTELIVVEATQSRKLDKTRGDFEKSVDLIRTLKRLPTYSEYNFRIMLITSDDPTADQNNFLRSARSGCPKEIISFTTLFSRLFDARHYVRLRGDHSFGSVRNPANEADFHVPPSNYIPTSLNRQNDGAACKAESLASDLTNGGRFIIYGDYGSGKSMTLRDIFFRVRDKFAASRSVFCPIYLNLREHIAQTQPDEALYRHADKIGFSDPHSLISAWRAGFIILFLDGFDELTPPQFASSVISLRQARKFAVELVRRFLEQTPQSAPVIIAGRESYFDDRGEAQAALGYQSTAEVYDLAGFTDEDIARFFRTQSKNVPSWLPTRPLLLGYLANSGLLKTDDMLMSLDPSRGWDQILQRVCEREVNQVWGVGFEASDLRLFIEALATQARKLQNGQGLEDSALRSVFRAVFGRDADEPANLLTVRLPGLGSIPGRPGAREFIDADLADAACSGDLLRFIESPFSHNSALDNVLSPIGELGRQIVIANISNIDSKASIALAQTTERASMAVTSGDLISTLVDLQVNYNGPDCYIDDSNLNLIVVDPEINLSAVVFRRCIISKIEFARVSVEKDGVNSARFLDCVIDIIEGAVSRADLPPGVLLGSTSVERFSMFTATNEAVMKSALKNPVKVLLTILRKLFMQKGSGRQYSALKRGLPPELRKYVDTIVSIVKNEGFAQDILVDRKTILIPNRNLSSVALSIVNSPNTSGEQLIERVRSL